MGLLNNPSTETFRPNDALSARVTSRHIIESPRLASKWSSAKGVGEVLETHRHELLATA